MWNSIFNVKNKAFKIIDRRVFGRGPLQKYSRASFTPVMSMVLGHECMEVPSPNTENHSTSKDEKDIENLLKVVYLLNCKWKYIKWE